MCGCTCECSKVKQGKQCLTKYTPMSLCLPPSQWVVADPGVKTVTVPATTQFLSLANLFSKAIMHEVCKDGCIEVQVLTGTVKFLSKPMGPTGCETFGEVTAKKFLLDPTDITHGSWCSPDGATVRMVALS